MSSYQEVLMRLFSAGEDACLAIWRRPNSRNATTATWQCIRQMRRHKGPITSLCLHPSSRIAFTLSEDKTLRVWNLMRGRQAYTTRLKSLNAEGASAIDITGHFLLISWPYDRLDVVDLNQNKDKPVLSAKFSTSFSVPPVVFHEDEEHLYLLIGFGNKIKAFRCPIAATMANASKLEPLGESRLPGKRLKFLKVLPWPAQLVSSQPDLYGGRRRLVTLVTTDIDGSYVRGYAVDLETSTDISSPDALRPVFAYDIRDIRLTRIDTVWASTGLDKDELQSADVDMEEEEDDGTSEEEVDKDDESV
uniref:WD_REPEATS_REGION domain-containing protein n=1 Tax=Mesocestoides corti TaxID=53468 RepID=A0A5K3ETI2_MESCO